MVKLGKEMMLENMKAACKDYLEICSGIVCDILAGERGPSYTVIAQMKNLNLLHDKHKSAQETPPLKRSQNVLTSSTATSVSEQLLPSAASVIQESRNKFAASVPLSHLLGFGKLIVPKKDEVSIKVEEFSILTRKDRK